jgi:hypothetical protein
MKTLRQLTASALLLLVLSLPALAGDMHCPVVPPPPPPEEMTRQASISESATAGEETTELNPLTEFSLLMLQGALALF